MSSNQIPICQPFQNNHETHVPESNPQENDLRQELENKIQRLFEINCIRSFQHDTKRHLQNSDDNSHFHFQRIEEIEFV
jgi:ribosomal protein S13